VSGGRERGREGRREGGMVRLNTRRTRKWSERRAREGGREGGRAIELSKLTLMVDGPKGVTVGQRSLGKNITH
jgi:hypothetical protein